MGFSPIDHYQEYMTPNATIVKMKSVIFIDVGILTDRSIKEKEQEKFTTYRDLRTETDGLWRTSYKAIPKIIGALGGTINSLNSFLPQLNIQSLDFNQLSSGWGCTSPDNC